jgi:hypothetical protein
VYQTDVYACGVGTVLNIIMLGRGAHDAWYPLTR